MNPAPSQEEVARQRAESLKERVYVSFTSLVVILALQSHAYETTPLQAALTLAIAVIGTLLAVLLADFLSHLAVHAHLPTKPEARHMLAVAGGAAGVLVVPLLLLGAAGLGWWDLERSLGFAVGAIVLSLALIGYLAVRRLALPAWQKTVILLAEVALSLLIIGLELFAHS